MTPTPPQPGDKVLYRLHGGAYIQLSVHPVDPTANIALGILAHVSHVTRTFGTKYRSSSVAPYPKANAFPAAPLGALAGYVYLVERVEFRPEDVIVQGDSAGGNLALALIRCLRDYEGYHPDHIYITAHAERGYSSRLELTWARRMKAR